MHVGSAAIPALGLEEFERLLRLVELQRAIIVGVKLAEQNLRVEARKRARRQRLIIIYFMSVPGYSLACASKSSEIAIFACAGSVPPSPQMSCSRPLVSSSRESFPELSWSSLRKVARTRAAGCVDRVETSSPTTAAVFSSVGALAAQPIFSQQVSGAPLPAIRNRCERVRAFASPQKLEDQACTL